MPEFKQGLGDDAEHLNDVAYALAKANVHLSDAQDWSTRAVSTLSEKTMDITPSSDRSRARPSQTCTDKLGLKGRAA